MGEIAAYELLAAEWGILPVVIEETWTNSFFLRMVDALVERKEGEAAASDGKRRLTPEQKRRQQIFTDLQAERRYSGGEYPLLKSKRVASGN